MSQTKPWNIKEGVYTHEIQHPQTQSIDDIRKKGLQAPTEKV